MRLLSNTLSAIAFLGVGITGFVHLTTFLGMNWLGEGFLFFWALGAACFITFFVATLLEVMCSRVLIFTIWPRNSFLSMTWGGRLALLAMGAYFIVSLMGFFTTLGTGNVSQELQDVYIARYMSAFLMLFYLVSALYFRYTLPNWATSSPKDGQASLNQPATRKPSLPRFFASSAFILMALYGVLGGLQSIYFAFADRTGPLLALLYGENWLMDITSEIIVGVLAFVCWLLLRKSRLYVIPVCSATVLAKAVYDYAAGNGFNFLFVIGGVLVLGTLLSLRKSGELA